MIIYNTFGREIIGGKDQLLVTLFGHSGDVIPMMDEFT